MKNIIYVMLYITIFLITSYNIFSSQSIYDKDVDVPLISHNKLRNNDNLGLDSHMSVSCCIDMNLISELIEGLLCCKRYEQLDYEKIEEPHIVDQREYSDFLNPLPIDIIELISDFCAPPINIVNLSRTCYAALSIFSEKYWARKCNGKKWQKWSGNVSFKKVYIANIWYLSGDILLLKKADKLGHPASRIKLEGYQFNIKHSAADEYLDKHAYHHYFYCKQHDLTRPSFGTPLNKACVYCGLVQ